MEEGHAEQRDELREAEVSTQTRGGGVNKSPSTLAKRRAGGGNVRGAEGTLEEQR